MTKEQEKVIQKIWKFASDYHPVSEFNVSQLDHGPVSVAVWYHDPGKGWRTMHLFVGPRGGIKYPVQKGDLKKAYYRVFDWNIPKTIREQEAGWEKCYKTMKV